MGCIQSTPARTHSPQRYELQEQATQTPQHFQQAVQTPQRPSFDDTGVGIIRRNLQRVLDDTDRLVNVIARDRQTIGGSMEPLLRAARNLSDRIQRKMNGNVARGSGADTYRTTLESIRRDYTAIITANAGVDNPDMFPEYSTVFEIHPASPTR